MDSKIHKISNLQYNSDKVRLQYIQHALLSSSEEQRALPSASELYNLDDLVSVRVTDDGVYYSELFVSSCWDALYQKPEYQGLTGSEAIKKLVIERFSAIAEELGMSVEYWNFEPAEDMGEDYYYETYAGDDYDCPPGILRVLMKKQVRRTLSFFETVEYDTESGDDKVEKHYDEQGELHNSDGPAVVHNDGTQEWWYHGQLTKVVKPDGTQMTFRNNKLHNDSGPAVVDSRGNRWYFIDGQQMTQEDFESRMGVRGSLSMETNKGEDEKNSLFICFWVPEELAGSVAGLEKGDAHMTLVYVPDAKLTDEDKEKFLQDFSELVTSYWRSGVTPELELSATGVAEFNNDDNSKVVIMNFMNGADFYARVCELITKYVPNWNGKRKYDFIPHITLNEDFVVDDNDNLDVLYYESIRWIPEHVGVTFKENGENISFLVDIETGEISGKDNNDIVTKLDFDIFNAIKYGLNTNDFNKLLLTRYKTANRKYRKILKFTDG